MGRPLAAIQKGRRSGAVLLLAIGLAGCGGSGSGLSISNPTVATKHASIRLTSTAIRTGEIPARYTCDGANVAPPLKWGAVPSSSSEVVLFALAVTPGQSPSAASPVEWAMAGLKPELHGIKAGELPQGAYLVEAGDGKKQYSICPPRGQTRHYAFVLYAMPPGIAAGTGISGAVLLRNLAEGPPADRSPARGELSVSYKRR
jgi:phosphatidylethanolamine-binding protein (PEBP) family uncharacterized protein